FDGIFDTDGQLLWNNSLNKLLYVYYYRNKFLVIDKDLQLIYRGKTIDTVNQVPMDIANLRKTDKRKLNTNVIVINENAATDKNLLFIQTDRLGKFESDNILSHAEIIDVYDLDKRNYAFSFYLYRPSGVRIRAFIVKDLRLYALMGSQLVSYTLNPKIRDY